MLRGERHFFVIMSIRFYPASRRARSVLKDEFAIEIELIPTKSSLEYFESNF